MPTETTDPWNAAYKLRPLNPNCDRKIEITIVGKRCIYINDYRVQGGKSYVSQSLPMTLDKQQCAMCWRRFPPRISTHILKRKLQ
jgi:hypothetical protein